MAVTKSIGSLAILRQGGALCADESRQSILVVLDRPGNAVGKVSNFDDSDLSGDQVP